MSSFVVKRPSFYGICLLKLPTTTALRQERLPANGIDKLTQISPFSGEIGLFLNDKSMTYNHIPSQFTLK
jgi:hypothetical protein